MERVKNITDLKKISAVAWHVIENADGDCVFNPQTCGVRFEDEKAGQYWELPLYFIMWTEEQCRKENEYAQVMLNYIFAIMGILNNDEWIGWGGTVNHAVNKARMILPKKESYEGKTWFRKEYVF